MEFVFEWITQYGLIALYLCLVLGIVGLPIPDETLMVFCGYLISKGTLPASGTWMTAFFGSVCGITISYWLGRQFGMSVFTKYGKYFFFTPDKLDLVLRWFDRIGPGVLFIGYYIAGVRHFSAVVAGTGEIRYWKFALFAYSGGAVWVSTFLTLGYIVGENWKAMAAQAHRTMAWAGLAMFVAAALVMLVRWQFKKRAEVSRKL